jgi:hypothetical protein
VAGPGAEGFVAWQDAGRGISDVRLRRLRDGRPAGQTVRVDDRGAEGTNAWRPDLAALPGGRLLAAWADERDGPPRIFAATAAAGAIP